MSEPTRGDRVVAALQPTLDPKWGLPLGQGGGRDNLIKDTAVGLALSEFGYGEPTDAELYWIKKVQAFLNASQRAVGLWYREEGNPDRNSVDNLVGTVVACRLLGLMDQVKEIMFRADEYSMTFSIPYPETRFQLWFPPSWRAGPDWYGRFTGLYAFIKLAQPDRPRLTEREQVSFRLACGATCATPYSNTSDKILLWLQFHTFDSNDAFAWSLWNEFRKRMHALYPRGPAELLAVYYGYGHPFAELADQSWLR